MLIFSVIEKLKKREYKYSSHIFYFKKSAAQQNISASVYSIHCLYLILELATFDHI